MSNELINVIDVVKHYKLGRTTVEALKGISMKINKGDFLSIVGPSGSGKTTLLNLISCLDKVTSGEIFFNGKNVAHLNDKEECNIRLNKIGFIFQSFNLIPVLNIFENVEFPLIVTKKYSKSERQKKVNEIIEAVGLNDFIKHKPDELSGGQRQRVAIARALVNNPSLVIADEPTANLDSKTGNQILSIMKQLNENNNVTFIFSTHDPEVMKFAKKVVKLKDGLLSK